MHYDSENLNSDTVSIYAILGHLELIKDEVNTSDFISSTYLAGTSESVTIHLYAVLTLKLRIRLDHPCFTSFVRYTNTAPGYSNGCMKMDVHLAYNLLKENRSLIFLAKTDPKLMVGIVAGHCGLRAMTSKWSSDNTVYSRLCQDDEETETVEHLLCL